MENASLLLVGLGNPADKYTRTRHNIGRRFVEYLLAETKNRFHESRQAEFFRLPVFFGDTLSHPLLCVRLNSYMNESGPALQSIMDKNGIKPEQIVVAVDDFMIPFGSLRLRPGGSSGGQNGLKSIIETLGTEEFPRLRFGIGPVPAGDPADFVLERFSKTEEAKLPEFFAAAIEGLKVLFDQGLDKAMNATNKAHF